MNETASDTESPSSDSESCPKLSKSLTFSNSSSAANRFNGGAHQPHPYNARPLSVNMSKKKKSIERGKLRCCNFLRLILNHNFL